MLTLPRRDESGPVVQAFTARSRLHRWEGTRSGKQQTSGDFSFGAHGGAGWLQRFRLVSAVPLGPLRLLATFRFFNGYRQSAITDQNGFYSIPGLIDGTADLVVSKTGYGKISRKRSLNGDARLDFQLDRVSAR